MSATLWRSEIGTEGYAPGTLLLNTTDNFATITAAGYMNNIAAASSCQVRASDFVLANYNGGNSIFTISITAGVITLVDSTINIPVTVPQGGTGDTSLTAYAVLTGGATSTSAVHSIASVGTAGQVLTSNGVGAFPTMQNATSPGAVLLAPAADQNITAHNLTVSQGNLTAGSSGHAGILASFPTTAAKGSLELVAVANTGNTNTIISNAAMGQASTVSIPDPGASTANFLLDHGVNTLAAGSRIIANKVNGTEAGNAVTASGMSGVITTSSLSAAAGASYAITWTNTDISTTSTILLSVQGGTNTTVSIQMHVVPGSGTATLTIYNTDPAASLNGTVLIGYLVI